MKHWSVGMALGVTVALAWSSPGSAGTKRLPPAKNVETVVNAPEDSVVESRQGLLKQHLEQRLFSAGALRQQLVGEFVGLPVSRPLGPVQVLNQGAIVQDAVVAPASGQGVRQKPSAPPATSEPKTAGDVNVISGNNGAATRAYIFSNGTPPVLVTHYASRFPTAMLAKQLPFNIAAAWFSVDDLLAWTDSWRFQVVLENRARPFWPDMATVVAPSTTFNVGTYFPRSGNSQINEFVSAQIPFANPPVYPATGALAIADSSHDDNFAAGGALGNSDYWFECGSTECNPGQINMVGGQLIYQPTAAGTTRLGWRLPDIQVGDCNASPTATSTCRRYYQDYIEALDQAAGINGDIFFPDQDIRLKVNYDLSGANARRAGVFFRSNAGATVPFANYYTLYLDKQRGVLALDRADDTGALQAIVSMPVTPFANTGELVAEVTGWNPITIVGKVNGTTVITRVLTGTDPLYHGDPAYGNKFGVIFPTGGGGEILDNFRMERNADLFLIAQVPPDQPAPFGARGTWFDVNQEAKEFSNVLATTDSGASWTRIGFGGTGADCSRSVNLMAGLQVSDSGANNNLFQTNNTLSALNLTCCTCAEKSFVCDSVAFYDECDTIPVSGWTQDTRPDYAIARPIAIRPNFNNEHAPNGSGSAVFCFKVCEDALIPAGNQLWEPWCACQNDSTMPDYNCDCFGFDQGAPTAPPVPDPIPGINYNVVNPATNDLFIPDGHPDGPLYLSATLANFTPPRSGSYHVFASEWFDLNGDQTIDDPTPDEFPVNFYVFRKFDVTGACVTATQNLHRNSLKLVKKGSGAFCPGTQATDVEAVWNTYTPPDPQVEYNLHFLDGKTALQSECPGACNPWQATSIQGGSQTGRGRCLSNPTITSGVGYYAAFTADNCAIGNASLADCSGPTLRCSGSAECCSGTCTAGVCQ